MAAAAVVRARESEGAIEYGKQQQPERRAGETTSAQQEVDSQREPLAAVLSWFRPFLPLLAASLLL